MKKIQHPKTLKLSKIELIKFQLRYILMNVIRVTETELEVLAYIYLYGRKAIFEITKVRFLTSEKTVENMITAFRKKGLVQGVSKETRINPNIVILVEDIEFTIKLELDDKVSEEHI